ncbi:MAG: hypothetical protein M1541_03520, partial [Acidobacteria bacterium]|nr:hypothetical protein [Acidobacteriota bacterium]
MDQAEQFLEALFAGKSDGEHILIWLLDGKRSSWFTDLDRAAAFVHENRSRDVYVGVALSPKDHGPHLRLKIEGSERMPSGIVGLWSDIDIADAVHKKKNLAPSTEQAMTVLFPEFPPSVLIHSGGGLQAWWLFKEPWTLESEAETTKAGALATRWIRASFATVTPTAGTMPPHHATRGRPVPTGDCGGRVQLAGCSGCARLGSATRIPGGEIHRPWFRVCRHPRS